MSFARAEYDENEIRWDAIRARLEDDDEEESEEYGIEGLSVSSSDDDDEDDDSDEERPARASRRAASRKSVASAKVAEARLPKLKAAAERMQRLKAAAIDPERTYTVGDKVYDPSVQRFGEVVWADTGYLRVQFGDGEEAAYGKPPMEDRKNFIIANFHRLDNKTMAEILDISVHTMRRLCHEYGLKRHKGADGRASA